MAGSELPVTHHVDCCIVGGSLAGVAVAAAAAEAGASVLVLAPAPFLGDDLSATFRWDPSHDEPESAPDSALARAVRGHDGDRRPTPMAIKRACEEHLLGAGVTFLYGCYPVAVARDAAGDPAGVVVASRSGRFVVAAGSLVDATWRATVARQAGVAFEAYPTGLNRFERVVIGGEAVCGEGIESVTTDAEPLVVAQPRGETASFPVHRYRLRLPMADASPQAFAAAEQIARIATYHPEQQRSSDRLWQVPPDPVRSRGRTLEEWRDGADLAAFASGQTGLWIAGPCADCTRAVAAELTRPPVALRFGERLGRTVAEAARARPRPAPVAITNAAAVAMGDGCLRSEQSLRWAGECGIAAPPTAPLLDEVDVLVMGGGTAGASAAIGAARQGARTLVVDYQSELGGVGTVGMITGYYFGNVCGFTCELDRGVAELSPEAMRNGKRWAIEAKQQWYRRELAREGAQVWTLAVGYGAFLVDGAVRGMLIATPEGCGLVRAGAVVDASGNADVAAHAGAATERIAADHVAIQGAGLGPRQPGYAYRNTDWTFADCDDVVDTTAAMVVARRKFADQFDIAGLVDTRERRRVIGETSLGPLDFLARRTFRDTVMQARSNFDTHGMTIHPLFLVEPPDKTPMPADVPLRCLLPRGLRGVVVTGLGKSAHRDALPVVRMQADVQNEGYAMGVASAWAATRGCDVRDLDVRELQDHLIAIGNLDPAVREHVDTPPSSEAHLRRIIAAGCDDHLALAQIFAHPERALPLLREALNVAAGEHRERLALILGLLGDASGAEALAAAIAARDWDEGWNYRGMGQFGASASPLDALIIGLGRSGAREHGAVVVAKAATLGPEHAMSHSRALAEAVEALDLRAAAGDLARLLRCEGVAGHHHHDPGLVAQSVSADPNDNEPRNRSLRELHLARALYRIGDVDGLGERILERYADDLRGPYARHARAVLAAGSPVDPLVAVS